MWPKGLTRRSSATAAHGEVPRHDGGGGWLLMPASDAWQSLGQEVVVLVPQSDPATLALHGVRLLGFAQTHRVASRFALDPGDVVEHLLDFQACGWVSRSAFAGTQGWSLTDLGCTENERRLAAELDAGGARPTVAAVHQRFLPLNARFLEAVSTWQVRPVPGNALAANDHTDFRWDDRVITSLTSTGRRLAPLTTVWPTPWPGSAATSTATRPRWPRRQAVRTDGSTKSASTHSTSCGCNCTKTSSPPSGSIEATRTDAPTELLLP